MVDLNSEALLELEPFTMRAARSLETAEASEHAARLGFSVGLELGVAAEHPVSRIATANAIAALMPRPFS